MENSMFSTFIYNVIDLAGINEHIKIKRIELLKLVERLVSGYVKHDCDACNDIILTGSLSEGTLPRSLTSDMDTMIVVNGIICVDEVSTDASRNFDILTAEYENMPPGYVKVRHIIKASKQNLYLTEMLSLKSHWYGSTGGAPFISQQSNSFHQLPKNLAFMNAFFNNSLQVNGPAMTLLLHGDLKNIFMPLVRDYDFVRAIPFYNESILKEWSQRRRRYDWPSEELIQEVSTMEGYIISVGEKQSENEHLEWRISHVTAEKKLVQCLNSSQYKLYVVLKLFSKQVFSIVSKSFSSYMVKNIVLWMAEIYPSHRFTPGLFIAQLLQSLNFIKQCLICNHLPSYMMPEKNLIARRRIFGHEKRELIILLSSLIDDGAYVIYRLPKLAACLNYASLNPNLFPKIGIWRHVVETESMELERVLYYSSFDPVTDTIDIFTYRNCILKKVFQDERLQRKLFMLFKLVMPEHLDRYFCVPPEETYNMIDLCVKRLQIVYECCFLIS